MHLSAALVPPREVLDHLIEAVADVEPAWTQPAPAAGGRHAGWVGLRRGRRKGQDTSPPPPAGPPLDLFAPIRMQVPIAKFGNLSLVDANRLADALEQQGRSWGSPRLRLHGGVVLEPEGDNSAWAGLTGDVDALHQLKAGVIRVAQGLQLFVDRRVFRPHLRLGTINGLTTEAYLEALLAALDAYEGAPWWQTSMSLLVPADNGPTGPAFKVHREIQLGLPVPH